MRKSFVVDLTADLALSGVRDAAFLHGYGEPVVLILHEREPTWAARMPLVNDTCVLTAVSINLDTKRCTVIWQREKLPWHVLPALCHAGPTRRCHRVVE